MKKMQNIQYQLHFLHELDFNTNKSKLRIFIKGFSISFPIR